MNPQILSARPKDRNSRHGFTLVELLVTSLIIAILIAILLPTVGAVKKSSSMAKCISNLRQIGTAINVYLGEHDNMITPMPKGTNPYQPVNQWLVEITDGYIGPKATWSGTPAYPLGVENPVYVCPSDPTKGGLKKLGAKNGIPEAADMSKWGINLHSYSGNMFLFHRKLTDVTKPSRTIIVAEFPWADSGTRAIYPNGSTWASAIRDLSWHDGRINCLFVDGHVETLETKTLVWSGQGSINVDLWAYNDEIVYPRAPAPVDNW